MTDATRQRLIRFCGGPLDGCELPLDPATMPGLRTIIFRAGGEYDSALNAMRPKKKWVYECAVWSSLFASCEEMWQAALDGQPTETAADMLVYRLRPAKENTSP